jgi:two-component system phosphate regulon sensor histidine kinase PhoR
MTSIDAREPTFEDLKLLTQVSQLLTLLDLNSVMQQVIALMSNAVGATKASLFLQDGNDIDWDHIFLTRDLDPHQSIKVVRAVLTQGLAGWVLRHRQATVVYDTLTDSRWHIFPDDDTPARSALCVPFLDGDQVLAVLTLVHPEPHHFDDHHLYLMTIVANQAVVALRNAQLFNQIQSQQRQLEIVLHAIPDTLIVTDHEGRILLGNTSAARLLGQPGHEHLIGCRLDDFPDADQTLSPARRIISKPGTTGDYWSFETRSETTSQDFLVTMSRWVNPASDSTGYVLVLHDVTTLRDLHRFKDEMLRVVSHDLRNPVALITTAYDMLKTDMPDLPPDSDIPQYLAIIEQSIQRMETMLDDLLRAETSSRQHINPVEMIEDVVGELRPLARNKNQQLQLDIKLDEVTSLLADPLLIREAITNYLSNAIKYTPRGGHIRVRAFVDDGRFVFIVEDDGIGIAPEHLPLVFEPYYRIEQADIEQEEGYGLGLSLVKTIIERHKGEVWVESDIGSGSRFGFWLPL